MNTGGLYNLEGDVIQELKHLEGERVAANLLDYLAESIHVAPDAASKLREWLEARREGVDMEVTFISKRSLMRPFTLDAASNRQDFQKVGNMYFLCYEGRFVQVPRKLEPVAPGEKIEAMLIWCCLAAS